MSESSTRPVLLIDDDGELFTTLIVLEEILTAMQPLEKDEESPAPDLGHDELNAVDRILMQLHAAEQTCGVEL